MEDIVLTQVCVSIVNIALGLTHKHEVDHLLARVSVFVEKNTILEVHVFSDLSNRSSHDDAVNKENDTLSVTLRKDRHVLFDNVVQ